MQVVSRQEGGQGMQGMRWAARCSVFLPVVLGCGRFSAMPDKHHTGLQAGGMLSGQEGSGSSGSGPVLSGVTSVVVSPDGWTFLTEEKDPDTAQVGVRV